MTDASDNPEAAWMSWYRTMSPRQAGLLFRTLTRDKRLEIARYAEIDDRLLSVMIEDTNMWVTLAERHKLEDEQRATLADAYLDGLKHPRGRQLPLHRFERAARALRILAESGFQLSGRHLTRTKRILDRVDSLPTGLLAMEMMRVRAPLGLGIRRRLWGALERTLKSKRHGLTMTEAYLGQDHASSRALEVIAEEHAADPDIAQRILQHRSTTLSAWKLVFSHEPELFWDDRWETACREASTAKDRYLLLWVLDNIPTYLAPSCITAKYMEPWFKTASTTQSRKMFKSLIKRFPMFLATLIDAGVIPPVVKREDYIPLFMNKETALCANGLVRKLQGLEARKHVRPTGL